MKLNCCSLYLWYLSCLNIVIYILFKMVSQRNYIVIICNTAYPTILFSRIRVSASRLVSQ
jgi:hypothetical protein